MSGLRGMLPPGAEPPVPTEYAMATDKVKGPISDPIVAAEDSPAVPVEEKWDHEVLEEVKDELPPELVNVPIPKLGEENDNENTELENQQADTSQQDTSQKERVAVPND